MKRSFWKFKCQNDTQRCNISQLKDVLDKLADWDTFTVIDFKKYAHHIQIAEEDRSKHHVSGYENHLVLPFPLTPFWQLCIIFYTVIRVYCRIVSEKYGYN